MKTRIGIRRQRGATLAEFTLVAGMIFVPLLLLTSLMGRQIEAKHHYEQALRYSAWERTAWFAGPPRHPPPNTRVPVKDDRSIGNEVQARILSDKAAKIASNQRNGNTNEKLDPILYHQSREYADRFESYRPRLKESQGDPNGKYIRNAETNNRIPGQAAAGVNTALNAIKGVTRFSVNTDGLYRSRVTMDLADVKWLKEFKDREGNYLDVRADRSVQNNTSNHERQLMLLSDGWNMGGRTSTRNQVKNLLLTSFLDNDAVRVAQSIVGWVPWAKELGPSWLELGKVDPDVVPGHRLGNYPR